jgi:hypothetical protein
MVERARDRSVFLYRQGDIHVGCICLRVSAAPRCLTLRVHISRDTSPLPFDGRLRRWFHIPAIATVAVLTLSTITFASSAPPSQQVLNEAPSPRSAQKTDQDLVAFLLAAYHNTFNTVHSGEYVLVETVSGPGRTGSGFKRVVKARCIFDHRSKCLRYEVGRDPANAGFDPVLARAMTRRELRKIEAEQSTDPKDKKQREDKLAILRAVVDSPLNDRNDTLRNISIAIQSLDHCVLWRGRQTVNVMPPDYELPPDVLPLDAFVVGLCGPNEVERRYSAKRIDDMLAEIRQRGQLAARRDGDQYHLTMTYDVGRNHVVRETTFDGRRGILPVRTVVNVIDPKSGKTTSLGELSVEWESRGDVSVPHVVKSVRPFDKTHRDVTFEWKRVNEGVVDNEFDYHSFDLPRRTRIIDSRLDSQRPAIVEVVGAQSAKDIARGLGEQGRPSIARVLIMLNAAVLVILCIVAFVRHRARQR